MTDMDSKCRFIVSACGLMLAMGALGGRLVFLHLGAHDEVRNAVQDRRSFKKQLVPVRGEIHDRNGCGNALSLNLALKDVCVDPLLIQNCNKIADVACFLSDTFDLPVDEIAIKLNRPRSSFAFIKRYVREDRARSATESGLPGIFLRDVTVRHHPQRSLMCHILGFVNREGAGCGGVEQYMDRYLKGCTGYLESRVNALRQEVYSKRRGYIPPLEGADVELTLDQNMQYVVETALDAVMFEQRAESAWAIVERVPTGEILAMASRPAFDLNEFGSAAEAARLNRAIGYTYEPGSTFKVAVIASALNERTVMPSTVFHCENGAWACGGRTLHDHHPYGELTVADGLKKSSNILAAKVALTLGSERLHRYLRAFCIGERMRIDIPGEERGVLHPAARWSKTDLTRIAIGHSVAVTSLQMLGVICAIANDGFLMRPYVVRRVVDKDGLVLVDREPEVLGRPIRGETAATMRRLLCRVTHDGGTGRRARVDGYEVAGKTGTANKPIAGGYSATAHMASFVGFLPVENPEIAIIVVVDHPKTAHTGGVVAAPVFRKIAMQAVRCFDVPSVQYRLAKGSL